MKLGDKGWEWISQLHDYSGDNWNLLSEWQQTFFTDYMKKATDFQDETFCSEKQLKALNKIAEALGVDQMTEADLAS